MTRVLTARLWAYVISAVVIAAISADSAGSVDVEVDPDDGKGTFGVLSQDRDKVEATPTNRDAKSVGVYRSEPACEGICTGGYTCPDGTFKTHSWIELPDGSRVEDSFWCPVENRPQVTEDLVARAFRRVPLPSSDLVVQPPGGRTLVNFETNFYTEAGPLRRTVRLLGRRVELRIEPHSYRWHFEKGVSVTTARPGAPYPQLVVTHNYVRKGGYAPAVDTTWVADFRVDGGPWRTVPGSVTIEGDGVALEAVEARPTLVGYDG